MNKAKNMLEHREEIFSFLYECDSRTKRREAAVERDKEQVSV